MENSPELDGKYLGTITKDFVLIANTLKEAAYQLKVRKISDFPIFPICKEEVQIGQTLVKKEEMAIDWNYNFSYVDEFAQRGFISEENLQAFKDSFKDPEEFCCLFVVDVEFINFVFVPYPEDED